MPLMLQILVVALTLARRQKNVQFASCLIRLTPYRFPGWSPLFIESSKTDHLVDKIESPVS